MKLLSLNHVMFCLWRHERCPKFIWTAVVREYFLSVSYSKHFTRLENVLKNVLHRRNCDDQRDVIDIRYKHGDESNYEQIIIQKTTRYN